MYDQAQLEALAHELVRRSYKDQMFISIRQELYYEGVVIVLHFNNPGTPENRLDGSINIVYIFANGNSETSYA
jgi:hypothetical protein